MEISKSNVFELLNITGTRPSKDFGQNFLIEPTICQKIADVLITEESDNICEIGPGLGSLTNFLEKKPGNLTCVDIDPKMIAILSELYKDSGINIVNNDIRKVNLENFTKIIGNLPYNITTELIVHLLMNAKNCKQFVFMIQAEAINRFVDEKGKEYGPASILVHLLGSIKKNFIVKAGSFYPTPKCNSMVFNIIIEDRYTREEAIETYQLAKKLFLNRRKTLLNNLSVVCGKENAQKVCKKLNIDKNTRPEEISPQVFLKIKSFI